MKRILFSLLAVLAVLASAFIIPASAVAVVQQLGVASSDPSVETQPVRELVLVRKPSMPKKKMRKKRHNPI